jgi:hypothetical protein
VAENAIEEHYLFDLNTNTSIKGTEPIFRKMHTKPKEMENLLAEPIYNAELLSLDARLRLGLAQYTIIEALDSVANSDAPDFTSLLKKIDELKPQNDPYLKETNRAFSTYKSKINKLSNSDPTITHKNIERFKNELMDNMKGIRQ